MYRPGGDLPQFRQGGFVPVARPSPGVMSLGPSFIPPPLPGGAYVMPQFSGGLSGFLQPISSRSPPLPSGQPPLFIPPLPQSPPSEVPPPPPPSPPPLPLEESSSRESLPPEPPKPRDLEMLMNIDALAAFVVKNGPQYESMARAKQAGDPKFAFLFESDAGHEAAIGHGFYKWKKHALELEFRHDAENINAKNLDPDKSSGYAYQVKHMTGQSAVPKEIAGSPTISDMYMEDDMAMPSPKWKSVVHVGDAKGGPTGKAGHVSSKRGTISAEAGKFASSSRVETVPEVQQVGDHPVSSDGLLTRTWRGETLKTLQLESLTKGDREHPGNELLLNKSESAQGCLKGERAGLIFEKHRSDNSDASYASQYLHTSENVVASNESSDLAIVRADLDEKREQGDAAPGQAVNVKAAAEGLDDQVLGSLGLPGEKILTASQEDGVSGWGSQQDSQALYAKESHSAENISPSNMSKGLQSGDRERIEEHCCPSPSNSIIDASNSPKESESPERDFVYEPSKTAAQQHRMKDTVTMDEYGRQHQEGASNSEYSEDECLPRRKRRRHSRSRSQSSGDLSGRRQSATCSPPRWERGSRSGSRSQQWQGSHSRSPRRDLRLDGLGSGEGDLRGDHEFQERGSIGGQGSGSNLCVYHAKGRCFRGSSCRFLHQSRKFIPAEQDLSMEEVHVEKLESEVSTEDVQFGGDVSTEENFEVEAVQQSHSAAGNNADLDEAENMTFDTQTIALVKAESCTQVDVEDETEADGEAEMLEEPEGSAEVGLFRRSELNSETEETGKTKLNTEWGVFVEAEHSSDMEETEKQDLAAEAVVMKPGLSPEMETERPEVSAEAALRKPEFRLEMEKTEEPHIATGMVRRRLVEGGSERDFTEKPVSETVVEWSPFRDEFLPPAISRGYPYQSEAPRKSIPALEPLPGVAIPPFPPFSQSKSMWQSIPMGSSSLTSQLYMPTGQSYDPGNFTFGLNQPNSLQNPLRSSNVPHYVQPSSFREPVNNTNTDPGNNFHMTGNSNIVQPVNVVTQFSGQLMSGNLEISQPYPTKSPGRQAFLPGVSMYEMQSLSQSRGPPTQISSGNTFPAQPVLPQISVPSHQSVLPPFSQPVNFHLNPSTRQSQGILTDSASTLTSLQHGFSPTFSLPIQQPAFPHPFVGDTSKQFTFPSLKNNGIREVYSRSLPTLSTPTVHSPISWMLPESLDLPASLPVSAALPLKTGQSSYYAYALTTIPPLSSLIKLPGVSDISTSGDQYDPLSDSLEPAPNIALKPMSYDFVKAAGNSKSMGSMSNTIVPHLENVSPGPVMEKTNIVFRKPDIMESEIANINDAAADPGVGIVENVSPPDDNRNWSPEQAVDGTETGKDPVQAKIKKSSRGLKLLRSAVAEYVKEVLKPTWRGGQMSKDAFKTIVKKVVDKVTGTLPSHHIPKSQEKVDQFMQSSRSKISKLVQGYVDKHLKA